MKLLKARIDGNFNDVSPASQLMQASFTTYMENDTVSEAESEMRRKGCLWRTSYKGAGRTIHSNWFCLSFHSFASLSVSILPSVSPLDGVKRKGTEHSETRTDLGPPIPSETGGVNFIAGTCTCTHTHTHFSPVTRSCWFTLLVGVGNVTSQGYHTACNHRFTNTHGT